ncbi:hypothetical protein IHV21_20450 [Acinetobacter baumannii]|uniref:hypothetical protein n=1 Tax=Acinetobacter baumannii TaxID=470 RepID=UPI00186B6F68|nr:hypothetical protein [Acinetobacter baumannii]MBE4724571.1 hypothetical protein [Acinetobacter baumannii]MDV7621862.1 hypothetical protein [Acinetobacter baumannii]
MPNNNSSLKNSHIEIAIKTYDASDVSEGYALAYEQVADLAVMLDSIRSKYEKTAEYLQQVYSVPESVFKDLKRLLSITDSIIDENLEFSKAQEDKFQKEYEESQA